MIPKINLHIKFINNTQTTKNHENSSREVFLAFRLSTGYYFFKKTSLVNVFHHILTHHVIHINNIH